VPDACPEAKRYERSGERRLNSVNPDNLYDDRDVHLPSSGWRCERLIPFPEGDGSCQACGKRPIRYLHELRHANYDKPIRLCTGCARKLEADPRAARWRVNDARDEAKMRAHWREQNWWISENQNWYLRIRGFGVTLYETRNGSWAFFIDHRQSSDTYDAWDEAMAAAFDAFWQRRMRDVEAQRARPKKANTKVMLPKPKGDRDWARLDREFAEMLGNDHA